MFKVMLYTYNNLSYHYIIHKKFHSQKYLIVILGYSGLSRLYRLRFIAHHCPVLRIEALKLGIHHVQQTHNTILFAELHKALAAAQRQVILVLYIAWKF